ncbi:hypothetical protein F5883DRAFT_635797 [Diaporthe sp. PMI_573]|nr:hypothetical protein F5883DRAFT_635797 [Diaporthaceae sp. PMI_573]
MDETLDPAIIAVLPFGCEIIAVNPHGKGSWSARYKVLRRPGHLELQKYLPENTVVPLAYGPLELDSSASFFLTSFRNLSNEIPEPSQLAEVLERLHKSSVSPPTGKFGFHITTFHGIVPLVNEFCDTWEEFFSRQLRSDTEWEQSIRGPDPEMRQISIDLGMMREPRYRFTAEHTNKYLETMRSSQAEEDFDDQNAVYAMRDNIINAGLHDHRAFLRSS